MSEQTTADLSRKIAEYVGDRGFSPERDCPGETHSVHGPDGRIARQGGCHENWHEDHGYYSGVGDLCPRCLFAAGVEANATQEIDPSWHPEWRIGRGEPKPYAEDLNLIVPVVEAWCQPRKLSWLIHGNHWTPGRVYADVSEHPTQVYEWNGEQGPTPEAALARAFLAAVERWGRDA